MSLKSSLWSVWAVLRCTGLRVTRGNSASSLYTDLLLWTHHHQVTIIIIIMGNDMSCGNGGNRAFIERQMSNASGKDVATIQGFYNDFRNECPSGKKVSCCLEWWSCVMSMFRKVESSEVHWTLQKSAGFRPSRRSPAEGVWSIWQVQWWQRELQRLPDGSPPHLQRECRGQAEDHVLFVRPGRQWLNWGIRDGEV